MPEANQQLGARCPERDLDLGGNTARVQRQADQVEDRSSQLYDAPWSRNAGECKLPACNACASKQENRWKSFMLQHRCLEEISNVPHLVVVLLPSLAKMMRCDSVKRGLHNNHPISLEKQSATKGWVLDSLLRSAGCWARCCTKCAQNTQPMPHDPFRLESFSESHVVLWCFPQNECWRLPRRSHVFFIRMYLTFHGV